MKGDSTMGFFSKKPSPDEDWKRRSAPKPFMLEEGALVRVAQLLDAFVAAEGNDARIRATAAAIAATAGFDDDRQAIEDPSILHAPWQMLVAAARRAAQEGNAILAGKIFMFTSIWSSVIAPQLKLGDFFDMHLEAPSEAMKADIAAAAQAALPALPPDLTIWNSKSLMVSAASAARAAATTLLDAAKNGVQLNEAVLATARRTLEPPPAEQSAREPTRTSDSGSQDASAEGADDIFDEFLAAAKASLDRAKALASQVGLKYVELPRPAMPVGVGIAMAFGDTHFVVLSVMGGGNEDQLNITAGVLRDIRQDREKALGLCNGMVRDNPAYPIYLHDAQIGWDILVSNMYPLQLLVDNPTFFANAVRALPIVAEAARSKFAEAELGGQPFRWNGEELDRLLLVGMV